MLKTFTGHESHVYNVAFSPSGDRLVSCDLKGFVKRWDLPAAATPEATDPAEAEAKPDAATEGEAAKPPTGGEELVHLEMLHKYDPTFRADIGGARCMAFSADGKRLAIGGITKVTNAFAGIGDAVVALVDMAERKLIVQYTPSKKVQGTAWGVAPHPAGFWIGLTGGGGGGWFYFWRGEEAGEFFQFKLKAVARGMSLSPDGTQIAVAHSDRHLRFYSLVPLPAAS